MTLPDHLLVANTEKLNLSTVGEIKDWLGMEAVGNSPYAALYLENLKSLIEFAEQSKESPSSYDATESAALTLAGIIARKSESRYQKIRVSFDGSAVPEIEGVTPLREVDEADIMLASVMVNPDHPEFKNFEGSIAMHEIHSALQEETRNGLLNDKNQDTQF
jgi:hypothetical protein